MPPRSPASALRTATCGQPRPRSARRSGADPRAPAGGALQSWRGAQGDPRCGSGEPRMERGTGKRAEPKRAGRLRAGIFMPPPAFFPCRGMLLDFKSPLLKKHKARLGLRGAQIWSQSDKRHAAVNKIMDTRGLTEQKRDISIREKLSSDLAGLGITATLFLIFFFPSLSSKSKAFYRI